MSGAAALGLTVGVAVVVLVVEDLAHGRRWRKALREGRKKYGLPLCDAPTPPATTPPRPNQSPLGTTKERP